MSYIKSTICTHDDYDCCEVTAGPAFDAQGEEAAILAAEVEEAMRDGATNDPPGGECHECGMRDGSGYGCTLCTGIIPRGEPFGPPAHILMAAARAACGTEE